MERFPAALRAHQLPQQPVRRGRHHQRGRPPSSACPPPKSTAASTLCRRTSAVIHQYMREKLAGCGKMILGSTPTPATAPWAPWPSARAAASWPSSCWATPTMWPIPASCHLPHGQPRAPASARTTWPSPSWAPCSRTATSRTRSWSSSAPASRRLPRTTATASTS